MLLSLLNIIINLLLLLLLLLLLNVIIIIFIIFIIIIIITIIIFLFTITLVLQYYSPLRQAPALAGVVHFGSGDDSLPHTFRTMSCLLLVITE